MLQRGNTYGMHSHAGAWERENSKKNEENPRQLTFEPLNRERLPIPIAGNSATFQTANFMITPRGYLDKYKSDALLGAFYDTGNFLWSIYH